MSAFEGPQMRVPGLVCGATSLATKQFYFVKLHTDGTVIIPNAIADRPIGVLQNAPIVGEEAVVCMIGQTKVSANAALTYGESIGTHSDGQAAPYVVGDTTVQIVGQVLHPADTNGLVTAFIDCAGSRRLP